MSKNKANIGKISGRDIRMFLYSIVMAFSVWAIYNLSFQYSWVVSVNVTAVSSLEGHAAESALPSVVTARCHASGYSIIRQRLSGKVRSVRLELPPELFKHVEGELFSIDPSKLMDYAADIFGDQIGVDSFVSGEILFRFPYENCIKVPLKAVSMVSFKPQYMAVGEISTIPDSVMLYGEPEYLENITSVSTRPISISGVSSSQRGVIELDVPYGLRCSHEEADYHMVVSRFVEMRKQIRVDVQGVPEGKILSVYPSSAELALKLSYPVGSINLDHIRLVIDYNDFLDSPSGKVIAKVENAPGYVLDYRIDPMVFDCIEKNRE